jgi:hypothetical protein
MDRERGDAQGTAQRASFSGLLAAQSRTSFDGELKSEGALRCLTIVALCFLIALFVALRRASAFLDLSPVKL